METDVNVEDYSFNFEKFRPEVVYFAQRLVAAYPDPLELSSCIIFDIKPSARGVDFPWFYRSSGSIWEISEGWYVKLCGFLKYFPTVSDFEESPLSSRHKKWVVGNLDIISHDVPMSSHIEVREIYNENFITTPTGRKVSKMFFHRDKNLRLKTKWQAAVYGARLERRLREKEETGRCMSATTADTQHRVRDGDPDSYNFEIEKKTPALLCLMGKLLNSYPGGLFFGGELEKVAVNAYRNMPWIGRGSRGGREVWVLHDPWKDAVRGVMASAMSFYAFEEIVATRRGKNFILNKFDKLTSVGAYFFVRQQEQLGRDNLFYDIGANFVKLRPECWAAAYEMKHNPDSSTTVRSVGKAVEQSDAYKVKWSPYSEIPVPGYPVIELSENVWFFLEKLFGFAIRKDGTYVPANRLGAGVPSYVELFGWGKPVVMSWYKELEIACCRAGHGPLVKYAFNNFSMSKIPWVFDELKRRREVEAKRKQEVLF